MLGKLRGLGPEKKELDETIEVLDGSLKFLQIEIRHAEDEAAKLLRQHEKIINIVQLEKRKWRDMENRLIKGRERGMQNQLP